MNDLIHVCVVCEQICQPAPTDREWMQLSNGRGIHLDCCEHIYTAFKHEPSPELVRSQLAAVTTERDSLAAALAEANKDADRLAKELYDWLVFAEANDQIYAARSGMNAMLHHQKRKEGK